MNSFGTRFRVSIFGESHGHCVGVTIDGCPAGIDLSPADFTAHLERRRPGGAGTTSRVETDEPHIVSGCFNAQTTGSPITILFYNQNTRSADYQAFQDTPRPGHADFVLNKKFTGFNDPRGGGHASGRLTVCLVAAGVIARKLLGNIQIAACIEEVGGSADIETAIAGAIADQDSIGGIVSCSVSGVPVGLGEPFFNSFESLISHAVFSIPAIKAIEFGSGFAAARMTGSSHNDALVNSEGATATNHAGGINGGITNGNDIYFRVAVKPTSSTPRQQTTWSNTANAVVPFTARGRHDLCIALRVPVVLESVTAMVLADLCL